MELWPLWITSSINTFFENKFAINIVGEGEDLKEGISIRLDGPDIIDHGSGSYTIDCEINFIVTCLESESDNYKMQKVVGSVIAAILPLTVYEYGTSDGIAFGCLVPQSPITTDYFGQIHTELKLQQSIVRVLYKMELD